MPDFISAKALREERAKLVTRMRELADLANDAKREPRGLTAEEENNWGELNAEYDRLTRLIEMAERVEAAEGEQRSAPAGRAGREDRGGDAGDDGGEEFQITDETRALAMQAWFREQSGVALDAAHEEACRRLNFSPRRANFDVDLADTRGVRALSDHCRANHRSQWSRDLSNVLGSSGGYTVPEGFVNQLETNMLAYGGVLQVGSILRTSGGGDLPWPTADDTGNTGELLGVGGSIGSSVDPTVGQMVLKAHKFSSKLIKVPAELLEDSAFDLATWLAEALGERLGRVQNTYFTTGAGGGMQPRGLMVGASLGVTAASATAIAVDEIIGLEHSIDPAYRTPDAAYMCHDNILLHLRKLKDGDGQYLFQTDMRLGGPDTVNGRRVVINQDMDSAVTTGLKTIAFGQFSKYKIRQVRGVRMRRLMERYADTDQEGFVGFLRADGDLLDAGTAPVKYLQQA